MRRILGVLCLLVAVCAACLGTSRRVSRVVASSSTSPPFFPTNIPGGFSAFFWYEPGRSSYVTNGSVRTLPNLSPAGAIYDLTNVTASASPVRQPAALNGFEAILFTDVVGSRLDAREVTNFNPFEVVMVISCTNQGTKAILSGLDSVAHQMGMTAGGIQFLISQSAGTTPVSASITNRYVVLSCVFSNADSVIYTNNVVGADGSGGAGTVFSGLRLGARSDGGTRANFSLACMFGFTNQLLTTEARSNAFYYCTNRFATAVP